MFKRKEGVSQEIKRVDQLLSNIVIHYEEEKDYLVQELLLQTRSHLVNYKRCLTEVSKVLSGGRPNIKIKG